VKDTRKTKIDISERLRKYLNYIIIFLCLSFAFSTFQSIRRSQTARDRVESLRSSVESLENRKHELEMQINETRTEEYIETELRQKLGLTRENEIVIILPEDEVVRRFAPNQELYTEELPDPNWKKWVKLFAS